MILKRVITSVILFSLLILTLRYELILILTTMILGVLSILELFALSKRVFTNKFYLFFSNLFFSFYVFSFFSIFVFISGYFQFKILLFLLLLGCIGSDLGGYIFGKIFKGPKLTKISPNKTYAGAIGSILFISFLKRKANVKDTGNILPGHGGILDRLDGIFVGVPFGFLIFILFY